MATERFNGIKFEQWDREPEGVVRNVLTGVEQHIAALEADRERLVGHMVVRGWMTAEEALGEPTDPNQGVLDFDEIPVEALGERFET